MVGCQNDITTFDEVLQDDTIEIDVIEYDIKRVREEHYTYNKHGLKIETDMGGLKIEYIYDDVLLIQTNNIVDDTFTVSVEYHYKDEQLVRQDTIMEYRVVYDNEMITLSVTFTEYVYNNKKMPIKKQLIQYLLLLKKRM